ncbi:uncharacterized protein LOC134871102 [Eleginops maclovinus]|uniref:uncharacterized protein LOC134871102 n=1 Tax=Eleginops maclovinus TaxID=56733 RepID=UPI0030800772
MLNGIFFVCLSLSLCAVGSSLSCRWMQQKFKQFSKNSVDIIDTMANNSTNTTEDAGVGFPHHVYNQASKASAEDKLHFIVQILEEMVSLFEKDTSKSSWEENTEENFLQVVTRQEKGLRSCIGTHKKENTKLHMYFRRLSSHILKTMDHSAEAWELIRKEMKTHLVRADLLASSLLINSVACVVISVFVFSPTVPCVLCQFLIVLHVSSPANNSTNTTEGAGVDFPNHLYNIVSKASAEDKLSFTVQILEEMVVLFDEDKNNASWVKNTEENFLQIVTQLADGLRSCIGNHSHKKKNRKIQMYFKRLTSHVLEPMDHSAEAWELIRREMKTHLVRADLLASSLLTN